MPVAQYAVRNEAAKPYPTNLHPWADRGEAGVQALCRLTAYEKDFTRDELTALYGTKAAYRANVGESFDALARAGWILPVYKDVVLADPDKVWFPALGCEFGWADQIARNRKTCRSRHFLRQGPGSLEPEARGETDNFYVAIRKGFVQPFLPDAAKQNEVVLGVIGEAMLGYAKGEYDVIADGIVGPSSLPVFEQCRRHRAPRS